MQAIQPLAKVVIQLIIFDPLSITRQLIDG